MDPELALRLVEAVERIGSLGWLLAGILTSLWAIVLAIWSTPWRPK
jgi:hypothetical protein